ncbi:MAG: FAD-dependent oxidoreductase [Bryobacterales bacterium]|nr:FAD-dependent oxidoreductase [Bryobacterales bacterium]
MILAVALALATAAGASSAVNFDVVVVGGTPGGIATAIAAARLGHTVALTEYHNHLGGMSASGLGKTDIETKEAIAGLFLEFVGRIRAYYVNKYGEGSENVKLCRDGYYYEPSVAEAVFDRMVAGENNITVFRYHVLEEAIRSGRSVTGVRLRNRKNGAVVELGGKVLVDATYEGDLSAFAGARYRTGRESRAEFNELHAGVVYQNPRTRAFLAGTTGEGDKKIQAYTYRLCLTNDPANSYVLKQPPPGYNRANYTEYFDDLKSGRMSHGPNAGTIVRAFSIAPIPNRKFDANMFPATLAYPFAGLNYDYPEAGWARREQISEKLRNLTLGLLYFMQNDPEVREDQRKLARTYNLPRDEFTDSSHFPWQLYVREARRIECEYTLTENDLSLAPNSKRPPIHRDSISAGEYPFDSMPAERVPDETRTILEGYLLMMRNITRPYQLPYRIMVPKEVEGLLTPVPVSATHIAFSSVRLEPTWMALGQAAGVAAHLAITGNQRLRDLRPERIQRLLLANHQVLTFFKDMDKNDPAHDAMQFLGTKGFFDDYLGRSKEPVSAQDAARWRRLAEALAGKQLPPGPADGISRGEYCRRIYRWLDQAGY